MRSNKTAQPIESRILRRIHGLGKGSVFTPTRFLDVGSRASVDKALSRFAQSGSVRRLARGLYDYPERHPQFGLLAPSPDKIAAALVYPQKKPLQPSGAYAANLIGLSEQVPMKAVFLTTGTPRRVRIGRREIVLKRTTPRQIATAGRISGLVIQALRHLGKQRVEGGVVVAEKAPHYERQAAGVEGRAPGPGMGGKASPGTRTGIKWRTSSPCLRKIGNCSLSRRRPNWA